MPLTPALEPPGPFDPFFLTVATKPSEQRKRVTWIDAAAVVGQLHVGGVRAHDAHVRVGAD